MRDSLLTTNWRRAIAGVLAIALVGACRPKPPEAPPSPEPPPPAVTAPAAAEPAAEVAPLAPGPVAAPDAPPPAASATATAAVRSQPKSKEPALASMRVALPGAKLGAPVDLHYQFDGAVENGRPATLHLAAVPRVSGGNMTMSIVDDPLIQTTATTLSAQKASASTSYRQQVSVSRLAGGPESLKVLVTMELPEGLTFTHFTLPFSATKSATGKEQASTVQ